MNIIITESQYNRLLKEDKEVNFKSAAFFDLLYGTELSHKYNFPANLSSDDVWDIWVECRNGGDCGKMEALIIALPKFFPHYDISELNARKRAEIIMGMASEYNPSDIIAFTIHGINYENNIEQKRLEKQLPPEVVKNIRWVLSPDSIQQIRNKFGINEI